MDKICTRCHISKPLRDFNNQEEGKFGKRSQCKYCRNEQKRLWRATHPENEKEYERKRWAERAKKDTAYRRDLARKSPKRYQLKLSLQKVWRKEHPEKNKAYFEKYCRELSDNYARHILTSRSSLTKHDINIELLELHKLNIRMKRMLKERS